MSDFTDGTLSRYLDQQPGMRQALLEDPVQHMQVEALRRTLEMADCAMREEELPEAIRRRVLNRIVWGEPEGFIDVHARVREQMSAGYGLPLDPAQTWEAIHGTER